MKKKNGVIQFNKPDKALKCYANAVKNYTEAKVENSIAENYYSAGELMYDLKNPAKAKILLKKALSHAGFPRCKSRFKALY